MSEDRVGQVWESSDGSMYLIVEKVDIVYSLNPSYGWLMAVLYESNLTLPGRIVQLHERYLTQHLKLVA